MNLLPSPPAARGPSIRNPLLAILLGAGLASPLSAGAEPILGQTPIRGGLCVVLAAGDAALPASFVQDKATPFVVHALEPDPAKAAAARQQLMEQGLYGRVSVEDWNETTLPYADNLVSLLVVAGPCKIPMTELLRVVRPLGEIFGKEGGEWKRVVKPWPEGMDEWSHWRRGPDGNPVSKDRFVDVSARIQWTFARQVVSERTFAVYSGGRMFAFEGGQVVARDAFNGMPLWAKRAYTGFGQDIKQLGYQHNLGMIAADGDRVYFSTPDGGFKAHDAASEKLLMSYPEAGTPLNILVVRDGTSKRGTLVVSDVDSIRALDAESGRLLWKRQGSLVKHPVATPRAVFYVNGDFLKKEKVSVISCDLKTGKTLWELTDTKNPCPWPERVVCCSLGYDMIAYQAKVPYRWPGGWRKYYEAHPGEKKTEAGIYVVSAKTGEVLLETDGGGSSARHGEWNEACWVNDCLLKTGRARGMGSAIIMQPVDDLKGEPVVFDDNDVGDRGFGHCYPPTITERYYLYGQLNFVDLKTHEYKSSQITRGGCNVFRPGYLPANGLIYVHPKHCGCFPMLDGVAALASAYAEPPPEETKLVKGPAWGAKVAGTDDPRDWPMYRHDSSRTAGTPSATPADPKVLWTAQIKGPDYRDPVAAEWLHHQYNAGQVTQPVIAGGTLFVAQPDTHRLVALDAATGQPKWEFFANGRIDTPPTVHGGMCFVGSRSGWLFNVRASDGQLIWKLRVAPFDRRISMFGQVESPTPVPGSVAVIDGLVYAAAGLHPQADGGVRVVCVEPATGRVVWQNKYTTLGYEDRNWGSYTLPADQDPWRRTGVREYEPFDLPVRDGDSLAVSRWLFDLKTGEATLQKLSGFYQVKDGGVFLRRRAWSYAPRTTDRRTPLQVASGNSVFSDTAGDPRLFRVDFGKDTSFDPKWLNAPESGLTSSVGRQLKLGAKWTVDGAGGKKAPLRAMVAAGNHLHVITPENQLETYSTADGKLLARKKIDAPVWDGLAAAQGRLYLSCADGRVLCLGQ